MKNPFHKASTSTGKNSHPGKELSIIRNGDAQEAANSAEAASDASKSKEIPDARIKSPDEMLRHLVTTRIQALTKDLESLREKHSHEIGLWKDYEKQVNAWKTQVLDILQDLKKKADEHPRLILEIQQLRAQLKANSSR